ncbi:unnamed protein product, partial [Ilex paraguariensis]
MDQVRQLKCIKREVLQAALHFVPNVVIDDALGSVCLTGGEWTETIIGGTDKGIKEDRWITRSKEALVTENND